MELKPSFEENPEPLRRRRRRRQPRLVDEEGEEHLMADSEREDREDANDDDDAVSSEGYEVEGPAWHGWVFAGAPMLIILLGAGREAWSKGLAGLLLGLVMLCFPAQRRLPKYALLFLLAAAVAPATAFLPAILHGKVPWREKVAELGISVPDTITPQPWVTLEAWFVLLLGLLWLGWALSRGFSYSQRRTMLRVLAGGGILLCWLTIMDHMKWFVVPWWPRNLAEWGDPFGPFSNRNHISSLAAMTAVLCAAAAYDTHRRKERTWSLYAVGFILPTITIFMNTSRAGLLLLFLGMTLWLGTASMKRGFFKKMAVSASLVFMAAAILFIADNKLASRFDNAHLDLSSNTRVTIYRDSVTLTSTAPWTGIGLGNFDTLFALTAKSQDPRMRALHPESDVIWFLTEGGLLLVVPLALLLLWIARSTGPWVGNRSKDRSHRQDRRLRNTAAIVLLLGILHSIVDVPLHGIGYATLTALLAGITIRPRRLKQAAGTLDKVATLVAGAAVVALGAVFVLVAFGNPVLPGTSSAAMLRSRARNYAGSGSLADALPLYDRAIAMRPIDYVLYFERAQTRLRLGEPHTDVLQDFDRARGLEPHYAYMCYTEGVDWLTYRPDYAVLGWREFLKRFPQAGPGQHGYYRQMVQHAQPYGDLKQQLWSLATSLDLKLDFLALINTKADFDLCIRDILARQPDLAGLDSSQRMTLFDMWSRLGDRSALLAAIESNKTWQRDGAWKLLAESYAQKADFQRACELAKIYMPSLLRSAPNASNDLGALERAFLFNVMDARIGIDLFQAYKARGDYDRAISTLEKVKNASNPPAYIAQELAALYVLKEDYRRAWEHYREAASQTNR